MSTGSEKCWQLGVFLMRNRLALLAALATMVVTFAYWPAHAGATRNRACPCVSRRESEYGSRAEPDRRYPDDPRHRRRDHCRGRSDLRLPGKSGRRGQRGVSDSRRLAGDVEWKPIAESGSGERGGKNRIGWQKCQNVYLVSLTPRTKVWETSREVVCF